MRKSKARVHVHATVLHKSIAETDVGHSTLQRACFCKHANRLA